MNKRNRPTITQRVHVLVDASGSMQPLRATVVEELNRLVDTLRAEVPDARLSVGAFDSRRGTTWLLDDQPIGKAPVWRTEHYRPSGSTPLRDALDEAIDRATIAELGDQRAEHVLVAVLTDGKDNASTASALHLAGRVRRRKAAGWDFLYLGTGNALRDARRLGFDAAEVQPWEPDRQGLRDAFSTLALAATVGHG